VTLHIYRHPERFHLVAWDEGYHLSHHRWTVDTPDDYAMVKAIYDELGDDAPTERILALLDRRPDLVALNAHVQQKPV
jgi:spore coat polysaccharide biosynthesis protein SpsF